jgi:integrase
VLKALLNKAFHDGLVADDMPWRRVRPFENVGEARIRFLTDAKAIRLVKSCRPDLRHLVRARYGELRGLKVRDVDLRTAQVYISQSTSGKPRYIPLNPDPAPAYA